MTDCSCPRFGTVLPRRHDKIFYDIGSNAPLYYEDSQFVPLPLSLAGG